MFGSGQKAFPDVWKWSESLPGCLGVVGSPSLMSESGPESLPKVQE